MENHPILIIGAGPEGRIALDIFNDNGVLAYAFLTDEKKQVGQTVNDLSIFGTLDHPDSKKVLSGSEVDYIIAAGEPERRRELYKIAFGLTQRPAANAMHRLAWVSPYARIGFGNLVNAGVQLNANCEVGDQNLFHSGVSVEPDAKIGSFCTFNSGVRIGSNCVIGDEVFIGTGAIIYPGIKVGKKAIIGAGSVVLKSVEDGKTVHGNPAKEI